MISPIPTDESTAEIVQCISEQAERHSQDEDRLVELVADLDIQAEWFIDDLDNETAYYSVESIASICLYKFARGMSFTSVVDFLVTTEGDSLLGLSEVPSAHTIRYAWRNRFDSTNRSVIRRAALRVRFAHEFH